MSVSWYRCDFKLPASGEGRRISIEFDGVYRNAMVIFNGHCLGVNESGYAPFDFDVSDYVNTGGTNVLLVRADATLSEGWFYEGAGIYRHVWLSKTGPLRVGHWGTFVGSEIENNAAAVSIACGTKVRIQPPWRPLSAESSCMRKRHSAESPPNRGSRSASPPAALLISSWERQTMSKSGPASRKINAEPCSSGFSTSLIALLRQRAQAFDRRRFGHFRPMIASSTLATANPEPETTISTDCRKGPHVGRGRQQI